MPYSEQNIRGLAINFLRQHYKLRPRSGTSGTRVVSRVHYYQGVTIDARLAYQQPDLTWFTATVEATSVDRAQEVLYRVNYFRIAVHALLGAFLVLALTLASAQVQGESIWQWFGRPDVYIFLFCVFSLSFLTFGYFLSRLRYYRYIYAIAQFMRFHADAQWVAYDRKIFFARETSNNEEPTREEIRQEKRMRKYYVELQRQCVRFGFGLMEIRENNVVRWLVEPSHIDQFGGRRSRLPLWVAAIQPPPALKKILPPLGARRATPAPARARPYPLTGNPPASQDPSATAGGELPPPVPTDGVTDPLAVGSYLPAQMRRQDYAATIVPAKKGRLPWYKQPVRLGKSLRWRLRNAVRTLYPPEIKNRPGYYELPWWVLLSLFVLLLGSVTMMYSQSRWEPIARPDQKEAAVLPVREIEPAPSPESAGTGDDLLPGEYDHNRSSRDLPPDQDISVDEPPVVITAPTERPVELHRITADGEELIEYNCLDLYRISGTFYLLVEGRYPNYPLALERAIYLNGRYGLAATVVLNNCLEPGLPGYAIYLGDVAVGEASANLLAREFLRNYQVQTEVLVVN